MTTPDTEELAAQVARQEAELRKAREALERAEYAEAQARMEPLRALVERAHRALCRWNHTDGCAWEYERSFADPWRCQAHARWLRHYDCLVNGDKYHQPQATVEEIGEIVGAVENLKPKVKTALYLLRHRLEP